MPASQTRLYDRIGEPPSLGEAGAVQLIASCVFEVPEPLVGAVIALGLDRIVAPAELGAEAALHPIPLLAESLT